MTSKQMRFDARSVVHKEQFQSACKAVGVTMAEVLRDAMDKLIDEHFSMDSEEEFELQAIELEQEAEEREDEIRELRDRIECERRESERLRREADSLRATAADIRATQGSLEEDVAALAGWLGANLDQRVFVDHGRVVEIAESHDIAAEEVLERLIQAGVQEARVELGGSI